MAEQWLSIVEYARATGISDMTIRRRIRTGRIKAELKEGKYFIPVAVDHASGDVTRAKSASHGQQIVKNHPNAERPAHRGNEFDHSKEKNKNNDRVIPSVRRAEEAYNSHRVNHGSISASAPRVNSYVAIPDSLSEPLIEAGLASVEARALIEFCDRALDQAKSTVHSIEGKYGARLEAMNAQIQNRDQEIKALNQQIEDLQLLVQILERKKIG